MGVLGLVPLPFDRGDCWVVFVYMAAKFSVYLLYVALDRIILKGYFWAEATGVHRRCVSAAYHSFCDFSPLLCTCELCCHFWGLAGLLLACYDCGFVIGLVSDVGLAGSLVSGFTSGL